MMLRTFAVATIALMTGQAMAETPAEPFALVPTNVPGMSTGYLQPQATNRLVIGTRQPEGQGSGTGTQVYDGTVSARGYWPFQLGFSGSVFDDPLGEPFLGRAQNFSLGAAGLNMKYRLVETSRYAMAIEGNVTYFRYGFDGSEKEDVVGATLSLPGTYRLTDRVFANGELGYTSLPDEIQGLPALGDRGFVALGLGWQPSDRFLFWGSAKKLFREIDDGIEGDEDTILTLGAQYALTPQLAASVFVTNGYSDTPLLDDVTAFTASDDVVYGASLSLIPSGKRFNIPRYGTKVAASDKVLTFGDGITLIGPATIGSNEARFSASYGSSGNARIEAFISPDPDFQVEFTFEDYALEDAEEFRAEAEEDVRYGVGVRYQAMAEAEGDPFSLGARVMFGRDFSAPTVGVFFAEAAVRKDLGERADVTLNPKAAVFGDEELYGAGIGLGFDLTDRVKLLSEVTFRDSGADDIYAFGLRRTFREAISAIDIYATNASGRSGIGSLVAGETQVGVTFTYQPPVSGF
ncbi:hypothetical protein PARPLA_00363 [Rhodobacteraceae bacterium THAF1]|uniref:hypothetical protein n=1 Tax=Palleronia sp. THAF1 TaxID=2587842 RepID=UPI000F4158FF|nr:hypothetical protein [Palleronia sp. THAF1]QFU10072.1 hypothetical protein FIU81_15445 [Palleronia sp. THAF1]VDC17023.1 hypothetical protein PARPLA_00363 [Rhodobacteraceae bacterium THAF1]